MHAFKTFKAITLSSSISHLRPDIACIANRASQVTEVRFDAQHIRELERGIKLTKSEAGVGLRYGNLDTDSIPLRVYSDASFANNDDCSSQLGYLVVLANNTINCHILDFKSKKSKHVLRSIISGETLAVMNAFDAVYIISGDMERILGVFLEVRMYTDPKQLFNALSRGRKISERRLAVDIATAREDYLLPMSASVG